MSIDVESKLQEFRTALDKYMHLLRGGRVDKEKAVLVEKIQLELMREASEELGDAGDIDVNQALIVLSRKGWLGKAIQKVSREIGETVEDVERAVEAFLRGDIEYPGAMSALIVVQAVARLIASRKPVVRLVSARCPVCGAESKTMIVKDGIYMVCHFCGYQWLVSTQGMVCPYCGTTDPISIGVFTDKKRRIGLFTCQECGSTWRAILDRNITAPSILYPLIAMGAEAFRRYAVLSLGSEYSGDTEEDASLKEGER